MIVCIPTGRIINMTIVVTGLVIMAFYCIHICTCLLTLHYDIMASFTDLLFITKPSTGKDTYKYLGPTFLNINSNQAKGSLHGNQICQFVMWQQIQNGT